VDARPPAARRLLEPGALQPACFDAVRDVAGRVGLAAAGAAWPEVGSIDAALSSLAGVRFIAREKVRSRRRAGRAIDGDAIYEIRIASRREVPTRPGSAHDLLNALAWAAFPAGKWSLTAQLAAAQRERLADRPWRLPGARTRRHDRLALIDEGGILVACAARPGADELAADLATGRARALIFGHALLEHALEGCLDVWGAALVFSVDPTGSIAQVRARLDAALAAALDGGALLDDPAELPRLGLAALAA
jgi:hypothetical protein